MKEAARAAFRMKRMFMKSGTSDLLKKTTRRDKGDAR